MASSKTSKIELRFDHDDKTDPLNDTFGISIGTSVLPNKETCAHGPIFIPFGRLIIWWNTFLFAILIYSVIEIPYSIAFKIIIGPNEPIRIIGLFIDVCLMMDMFIVFRTAYIDEFDRQRIIHDPALIAKKYFTSWFFADLLSCLPLSLVIHSFTNDPNAWQCRLHFVAVNILRIIKLLRIIKIVRTFKIFSENSSKKENANRRRIKRMIIDSLKHIVCMLLMAHYFACFWYGIGVWSSKHSKNSWIQVINENEGSDCSNFVKYSYSFYWAIVTCKLGILYELYISMKMRFMDTYL